MQASDAGDHHQLLGSIRKRLVFFSRLLTSTVVVGKEHRFFGLVCSLPSLLSLLFGPWCSQSGWNLAGSILQTLNLCLSAWERNTSLATCCGEDSWWEVF